MRQAVVGVTVDDDVVHVPGQAALEPVAQVCEARRVARVLLGRIAEGRDPSDERRADRERRKTESAERRERRKATTSGPTLVGLVRRSIEAKEKRLSSRTVKEWTRSLVRDISPSPLGQMQASAIKRAELADWLKSLGDSGGPHQSDRVLTLIRASYRYALDEEAASRIYWEGHARGVAETEQRLRPARDWTPFYA